MKFTGRTIDIDAIENQDKYYVNASPFRSDNARGEMQHFVAGDKRSGKRRRIHKPLYSIRFSK
jgi:hypothetical protein